MRAQLRSPEPPGRPSPRDASHLKCCDSGGIASAECCWTITLDASDLPTICDFPIANPVGVLL